MENSSLAARHSRKLKRGQNHEREKRQGFSGCYFYIFALTRERKKKPEACEVNVATYHKTTPSKVNKPKE